MAETPMMGYQGKR